MLLRESVQLGTVVSKLAGAGNIADADTSNPKGIAIIATDSTHGTWYYSNNNSTDWTTFTATNTTARLLAANANTLVYFQPTANWQGSITSGLTIRAWDSSTGTNGGTAAQNLSSGGNVGGTTATTNAVLPATLEDTLTPNSALISGLAFNYSDVTDNQTINGGRDT